MSKSATYRPRRKGTLAASTSKELSIYRTKYRTVEGDQFTYSGKSNPALDKYRKLLKILVDEYNNVKLDVKVATSKSKIKQDKKAIECLEKAILEYEALTEDVKKAKIISADLDKDIKKAEKNLRLIRPRALTNEQYHEKRIAKQRSTEIQKNRLEAAVKKYDGVVAKNVELEKKIDHKLRERDYFRSVWNKFVANLSRGNEFLVDLLDMTSTQYDERDKCCETVEALRKVGHENLIDYSKDIRNYQRFVEDEWQNFRFYQIKGQRRDLDIVRQRRERRQDRIKQQWETEYSQAERNVEQIKEHCQVTDVGSVAKIALKEEQDNFQAYVHINELNLECDMLVADMKEIKEKIDEEEKLGKERKEKQINKIQMLEEKLAEEKEKLEIKRQRCAEMEAKTEVIFKGCTEIVQMIKCEAEPILHLLGNHTEVNAHNHALFFKLIESNIGELLRFAYHKETVAATTSKHKKHTEAEIFKSDPEERYIRRSVTTLVPNTPCPLCMESGQVAKRTGVLQEPRTLKEIKEKLAIRAAQPHFDRKMHSITECHHPKARGKPKATTRSRSP